MSEHFWLGMAVVFMAGVFNGSFALPMKYSRGWRWENTWGLFTLLSLVVVPLLLVSLFVPQVMQVYHGLPWRALLPPLVFGLLWGTAQVTFGLSIQAVGVAMALAIVCGTGALFGSLIPLLVLHPEDLFRPRGILLLVSIPILLLGLWLYAQAGRKREKEQPPAPDSLTNEPRASFAKGLALCIYTGAFGACINLGFAFGGQVASRSLELGANPATSTYPVWLLVLWSGFIPNLLYCSHLLFRNRSWALFARTGKAREILLALAMAGFWGSSVFSYGIGATMTGQYGTSVGYALWVAISIASAAAVGVLTGEWKGTSSSTRKVLALAMALVLASVIVLNLGGLF
jgi:L-rhamnose-H+ transport protein